MAKHFKLPADRIRPLAEGLGSCLASDRITVDGLPVGFFYRAVPQDAVDSGWVFLSGTEGDAYMDEPGNHGLYDVNTIANYDPSIIPLLDRPVGAAFAKGPGANGFVAVADWQPGDDA